MKNLFSKSIFCFAALILSASIALEASAHDGRRLDIQVINNQLFAQGFLSNPVGPQDNDGGGLVRPYFNVIHDHFTNIGGSGIATLPGFGISSATPLIGGDVTLELLGASKWTPPARIGTGPDQDFGTPVLEALSDSELISIGFPGSSQPQVDSNTLGEFTLASNINGTTNYDDIDLSYIINLEPEGSIYALEWQLSTTQPGIADSSSVYTLLSPDGVGFDQRLHFQTLALENFLGVTAATTAVPEPGSCALLGMMLMPVLLRRKR